MRKILLVVEDNNDILEDITLLLQFSDYIIINTNNTKAALGLLQNDKPDIIVCDICMPEINGLELFNAVQNDPGLKEIPFILMTADSTKSPGISPVIHKNVRILIKPFEAEELLDNIIALAESNIKKPLPYIDPY